MVDQKSSPPPSDNIKGLVQDAHELLETRMQALREGSVLASVRPSDARIFITAVRGERTVSDIAQRLGVTKQAVSAGVQRLAQKGFVALAPKPGDKREKLVVITEAGEDARRIAGAKLRQLEARLRDEIGETDLETLRRILGRVAELPL